MQPPWPSSGTSMPSVSLNQAETRPRWHQGVCASGGSQQASTGTLPRAISSSSARTFSASSGARTSLAYLVRTRAPRRAYPSSGLWVGRTATSS
jgi:hypothetical protein